jgi:hypothetical protein
MVELVILGLVACGSPGTLAIDLTDPDGFFSCILIICGIESGESIAASDLAARPSLTGRLIACKSDQLLQSSTT